MNGQPENPEEIDLYEILGVPKDAAQADIRKAYRKAALQNHPDKVPEDQRADAEVRFKAVSQAYEILSDEEKRHLYDAHGMAAFNGSGGPGMGGEVHMEDILNMFGMGGGIPGMGGMGGGMGGRRKMRRSPDENQKYEVTLEDLYKGKTVKFSSTKNVICSKCSGTGGVEKAKPKECSSCKGQGVRQILSQVGPGMLTQRMVECGACEGTGEVWNPKDKCKKCKGKRTTEERKQLELYIPRGAKEGDQIKLEGEADQIPGAEETGDIIFHLVEQPHEVFQRTGNDLSAKLDITLAEALTGFHRVVLKHLDGRGIELNHPQVPGQILRPGEVLKVPGEGMPMKRTDAKGDLYLVVEILFPEDGYFTDDAAVESLRKILPGPPPVIEAEETDEVAFEVADIDDIGGQEGQNAWEDDEDGPRQAQCQTQEVLV
ncbi:DnaJ-like protein xdj1 [Elasticomyces elasticus]|uniref:DnaJ-like protein xdj1 n=1 Tax=Exophiala sideris TaxID=1016849 RepID=A0ABR0JLJ3_9EURO|nr:DnaJ-like protein xdj1 [Elasticomyces elasticus]KAK5036481.1 DnaJ-like protein xdj1 [Exophiala sideris]KAK5066864.1 DnaJ-like protein xdj1 [Exophiala sideris]KAK5184923.1 DnaJ-like protein xdj1 [Eurotiomycetes sp. CCFEE 6388]